MNKILLLAAFLVLFFVTSIGSAQEYEEDIFQTPKGNLKITFIGHGTLMFTFGEQIIHVDPYSRVGDYSKLPKADIILITHEHGDHLDMKAIEMIRTERTEVICTEKCVEKIAGGTVMKNGDSISVQGLKIEAVPAYNIKNMRSPGVPYHPKGNGNGYIITIADKRVYVAGDTENTPEMKAIKDIDIAFLPMNLPYTMTPEMVADAAKAFAPAVLYPYHYGRTDTSQLIDLLKDFKKTEVRIRKF
jgi:L-ascorbate metabolism protein UlaG (beta-lactamase superfamily)